MRKKGRSTKKTKKMIKNMIWENNDEVRKKKKNERRGILLLFLTFWSSSLQIFESSSQIE